MSTAPSGPVATRAALAVEGRLFGALAVLRVVVLANTVAWSIYRDSFDRAALGWTCVGVMVVWTAVSILLYRRPLGRLPAVLVVDLGLAVGMLLMSPVVKGADFRASVPGFWVVGALVAWAVRFGWPGGIIAAGLLGAVDLLTRQDPTTAQVGQVFLMLLAGGTVGFVSSSLQEMAAERDVAQRAAAAAEERSRLARAVHDGVLQVLALVQRRGAELGGEAAQLGRLAGEQEHALRTLIRSQDALAVGGRGSRDPARTSATGDLAAALGALARRPGVEVALPGGPVTMPARAVEEIVAAVGACVDNVDRHVDAGAPAWVLLQDLGEEVEVSVRDEGPGIPEGRLAEAVAQGRLGVSGSIRGRVQDLGGTATLETGPHGTEWTFVVPKEQA